jgi:uncharacterized protein
MPIRTPPSIPPSFPGTEKKMGRSQEKSRFLPKLIPQDMVSCEWRNIVYLNYAVEPRLLRPFLPAIADLDLFEGKAWLSLVGMVFKGTRVLGIPVPFQQNYEQVNLQFYVRYLGPEGWKSGVVFLRELVPKRGVAFVARNLYREIYSTVPMRKSARRKNHSLNLRYSWSYQNHWSSMSVKIAQDKAKIMKSDSREAFFADRMLGYTAQADGSTTEVELKHPIWRVYEVEKVAVKLSRPSPFGKLFDRILSHPPAFTFYADGSPVLIHGVKRVSGPVSPLAVFSSGI